MTTTTTDLIGLDVDVYFNLHRKCWSIRDRKTRRVVAHADTVALSDVTFRVSAAGNARVRREGKKNVHAFARGTLVNIDDVEPFGNWVRVTYNPYKFTTFVNAWDETPIHAAREATFIGKQVSAVGTDATSGKVAA